MAKRDTTFQVKKELTGVVARGLNNFYVPEKREVVSPEAKELVNSLSAIVPTLQQYDNTKYEIKKTEEEIKGALAFKKNNELDFKKAVKDGLIPEGANPHFIIAYNQAELQNKGSEFQMRIKELIAKEKGKFLNDTNPNGLNTFISQELTKYMEENNIDGYAQDDIVNHFIPKVDAIENEMKNNISTEKMALIQENAKREISINFRNTIIDGLNINDENSNFNIIGEILNDKLKNFSNVTDINTLNDIAIENIILLADEKNNTDLLEIAYNIPTAGGQSLGDIPAYKALLVEAEDRIEKDIVSDLKLATYFREEDLKRRTRESADNFVTLLGTGEIKSKQDLANFIINNEITEASIKTLLQNYYENDIEFKNKALVEDQNEINKIEEAIFNNPYNEQYIKSLITTAIAKNDIKSSTAQLLTNKIKETIDNSQDTLMVSKISSFNQLFEKGAKLILKGEYVAGTDPIFAESNFRLTFQQKAIELVTIVNSDPSILPQDKQSVFNELLTKEYQRQITIYFDSSLAQANERKNEASKTVEQIKKDEAEDDAKYTEFNNFFNGTQGGKIDD